MNKMKALVRMISLMIIVCCLCGCRQNEKHELPVYPAYTAYVADSEEAESDQVWDQFREADDVAPRKAMVVFNGMVYTGNHHAHSPLPYTRPCAHEEYRKETDECLVSFSFCSETGELIWIDFRKDQYPSCSVMHSDCRRLADSLADNYITLSDYQVAESINEDHTMHTYVYYKEFGRYKVEAVTVYIDGNGQVSYFQQGAFGNFDDVKSIQIDEQKAKNTLEAKLTELYGSDNPWIGYEINKEYLVKTKNNQCALLYRVTVELQPLVFEDHYLGNSDLVDIIVLLG